MGYGKSYKGDIKKTIAMAIAGAFGFIIALLWKDVIIGIMKLAGIWAEGGYKDWNAAAIEIVTVLIITIILRYWHRIHLEMGWR